MVAPRAHLFGIRFNLETQVGTVFPLLVADGPSPDAVQLIHPFLLGYQGTIDRSSQASNKAFYVVAHGWDGGGIYTSFGGAWCADTAYRDLAPHGNHPHLSVLCGYHHWDEALAALTNLCRTGPQHVGPQHVGPCLPAPYICHQFFNEKYHHLEDLLGREPFYEPFIPPCLADLRHPAFQDPSAGNCEQFFDARSPPIPQRVDVPLPTSSAPSSMWSPMTPSHPAYNPSFLPPPSHPSGLHEGDLFSHRDDEPPPTSTSHHSTSNSSRDGGDSSYQESAWQRDRNKMIDRLTSSSDMQIPLKKNEVENWLLRFTTLFRRDCWSPGGLCILDHSSTTTSNVAASRDLCQVLLQLALKDRTNKVFHELNGAGGAGFLAREAGIELFQHLKLRLTPQDMSHLWEYYRDWGGLVHKNQESISAFSSRLDTKHKQLEKLHLSSFQVKLKLAFAILDGPYKDVFRHIYSKICVDKDPYWDLSTLSYEQLTEKLESSLKGSRYY
jgi:hypothetical protein